MDASQGTEKEQLSLELAASTEKLMKTVEAKQLDALTIGKGEHRMTILKKPIDVTRKVQMYQPNEHDDGMRDGKFKRFIVISPILGVGAVDFDQAFLHDSRDSLGDRIVYNEPTWVTAHNSDRYNFFIPIMEKGLDPAPGSYSGAYLDGNTFRVRESTEGYSISTDVSEEELKTALEANRTKEKRVDQAAEAVQARIQTVSAASELLSNF